MYFYIEPEVSGGLGSNSVIDSSLHPPVVSKLHYQFDGWMGDDLLETFPCYIVTEALANDIRAQDLSGFWLDDVEISKSEQFEDLHPNRDLPKFFWLKVTGVAGEDDFGIAKDYRLVVSEKALGVLKGRKIGEAEIEEFK